MPKVLYVQNGKIDGSVLTQARVNSRIQTSGLLRINNALNDNVEIKDSPLPESGYVCLRNRGEGFFSVGWRFDSSFVFNKTKLFTMLSGGELERVKAVFRTNDGVYAYNGTREGLTEMPVEECEESRIEVISDIESPIAETDIFACLMRV